MRKKLVDVIYLLFAALLLAACASGTASSWKMSDVTAGLKGKTEAQIVQKFGEPDRKYRDSKGNTVFEYRKPAEKESGQNTFATISSFGYYSGKDSVYVDIAKIKFKNGRVTSSNYEESVIGIAIPGSMMPAE
jgi:ABC-type Fe3+-hydroxamate transport system substrate-binding protein